jgi:putative sigma-54 modulation protein
MQIEVRGKNIEVTPALNDYAVKRIGKLGKYVDQEVSAYVALSVEGELQKVEVTIALSGLILRSEVLLTDLYAAIDEVVEKLERQLEKHKTKLYKRYRDKGLRHTAFDQPAGSPAVQEEPFKIVRSKRFALKPMDEEEAIMQMDLLGHTFFVFFNAKTEEVNVVYKRNDQNYGLIEPQF